MKETQEIYDTSFIPNQAWFSLKEVCALKNLNYKTACNRKHLQPCSGKSEGDIGGRKSWKRKTVISWIWLSDDEIEEDM